MWFLRGLRAAARSVQAPTCGDCRVTVAVIQFHEEWIWIQLHTVTIYPNLNRGYHSDRPNEGVY